MPVKIFLFLVFVFYGGISNAQVQTVMITDSLFDPQARLTLSEMDGWYFRQGQDSSWTNTENSMNGWKKMLPSELNERYADATGKVEGWFRITFSLDKDLRVLPSGMTSPIWAASDVYINGKLAGSFGRTGSQGNTYQENRPFWKEPMPLILRLGETYNIAIHVVDYVVPFSGGSLKSADGFSRLLILTTARTPAVSKKANQGLLLTAVWMAITGVISILFWFFWLLNTRDKKQLLFAVCCSFISLCILSPTLQYASHEISYNAMRLNQFLFSVCMAIVQLLVFAILIRVLNYKAYPSLRMAVYIMIGIVFLTSLLPKLLSVAAIVNILYVILCLFIVVRRWKKLKGAQWSIATGLLSAITFAMLSFATGILIPSVPLWANHLIYALAVISFPFGLLVYAAIRFTEINRETEIQASKVIQLSEEKKEQAINQQKILEQEVKKQTSDLRNTLDNLRSAQAQLIQSEKMASLGELTAGIAHEIQNPLNFVNNFSEVNKELIEELKSEKSKGKNERDEKLEDELLNDISQNLEKINHHGKRADSIVKGMLQHSQSSTGVKELTDVNKLADEYLRLAYHGLRAKDKSFNATLKTDYDESIGNVSIIPQDIGRVILNLINNAFYAVDEKKKHASTSQAEQLYEPTVSVSTKKIKDKPDSYRVEIRVADNGNGIPPKVVDKIFQPFFTTKPTGQGTGLGLSLSYDIIKAHGGEIKVHTREGEGTEFIISLDNT